MKKVLKVASAALVAALFSLPVSAMYMQTIDNFESGSLGSWLIEDGVAADVGVYGSISAHHDEFIGPTLYYPPQGSQMMVISGGDPKTTVKTTFTAYPGAQLMFSWFFATLDAPSFSYDDRASVTVNGDTFILAESSTTGLGVGGDNTGWMDFSMSLSPGVVELLLSAENVGDFLNNPRLAADDFSVMYANGIPPELQGGGGTGGGGVIPSIPEPSTVVLFGVGLIGLSVMRNRRRESLVASAWKPTGLSVTRQ